jgi:hypothetical protein
MAKTTLKERLKQIGNDLFDGELANEKSLADLDDKADLYKKDESSEKKNPGKMYSILRQALLFAPGAVFLWLTSWGIMEGLLTRSRIPLWEYFLFVLSFFMVVSGLGDARKRRDYFIPLSSVFLGASFGVMSGLFTDFLRIFVNFITPAGLFSFAPLIWIVPVFVKLWLDVTEKENFSDQHK